MAKVLFLDDYRAGVHSYYPELGERKPEVKMEASLVDLSRISRNGPRAVHRESPPGADDGRRERETK